MPTRRPRASSMSRRVGTVRVANTEHLLHDLADGRQGVELAALHLVEQPPELGIVGDSVLEMRLRTRRRDRKDLPGQVAPPPRIELVVVFEKAPMLLELLPEHVDVLAAQRLREHDRRLPLPVLVEREN